MEQGRPGLCRTAAQASGHGCDRDHAAGVPAARAGRDRRCRQVRPAGRPSRELLTLERTRPGGVPVWVRHSRCGGDRRWGSWRTGTPDRRRHGASTSCDWTPRTCYLDTALRTGRHREVLATARAQVEDAPLRERRWALLALAQYQSGQQAEALRTLHEVRTVLSSELGLDPGPDLVASSDAIHQQDPVSGRQRRRCRTLAADLPLPRARSPTTSTDAEDFYGRDADIAAGRDRLTAVGALTVVGPSGSGKSSLVRAGPGRRTRTRRPPGRRDHPRTASARSPDRPARRPAHRRCWSSTNARKPSACATTPLSGPSSSPRSTEHAERAPLIVAVRADRLGDLSAHVRVHPAGRTQPVPAQPDDLR